jgi:hypothetical protein
LLTDFFDRDISPFMPQVHIDEGKKLRKKTVVRFAKTWGKSESDGRNSS